MENQLPKKLLVTGGAGIVASLIRPLLKDRFPEVFLTDREVVSGLDDHEHFLRGDLTDLEFLTKATAGIDGILHLGGLVGPAFTFEDVLDANIIGTRNVFEAARRNGVPRVVYASSHHAVGFMQRSDVIDHATAPRPDSYYGLSKAFGEEVGSYYANRFGIRVLSIRIGFVGEKVIDERRLHTWISPRDFLQLVAIGFTHPKIRFETVYGVSNNPDPFFNNANADRLGYRPEDSALDHLADETLREAKPDSETADGVYIGGHFVES